MMSRETSDANIECTNENPVAMCDEAEPAARGCVYCKYGVVSSVDHGLVVATLQEENARLKEAEMPKPKDCSPCEEYVIGLEREVERLKAKLGRPGAFWRKVLKIVRPHKDVPLEERMPHTEGLTEAAKQQWREMANAALADLSPNDIVEPCEESAEKDGGDDD